MHLSIRHPAFWSVSLLAVASLVLAVEPVSWLVNSWLDPSYDSIGGYVYVLVAALFVWSATSPLKFRRSNRTRHVALFLLATTALVRLAGRLLAINALGAFALVVDVFALAKLAGLDRRARALSPGWLAFAFSFALPLERIAQRLVGFGLQRLSAGGACSVLDLGFGDVACIGTRIVLAGRDVQVDLPCSGARGLIQLLLFFGVVAALKRPIALAAAGGFALTMASGFAANTLRITVLAVGLAWPESLFDWDVMAQPLHDLIGLGALSLGALPVLSWGMLVRTRRPEVVLEALPEPPVTTAMSRRGLLAAAVFTATACLIVVVPGKPVDVSPLNHAPILPESLADRAKEPLELSARELSYFAAFGGGVAKARYGEDVLLLVSTTSPLRHLHAPDECLLGSGHEVHFVGTEFNRMPTAVYRSVAPDGRAYRVAVTYLSDDGTVATSVPEVVWHWMRRAEGRWTEIQRISAWEEAGWRRRLFDEAVARSFDLPRFFEEPEALTARGNI